MKYESISEIYAANEKVRAQLKGVLSKLTEEQLTARPDGEKWNIQQIVEHISIVDESTMKICAKLLKRAKQGGRIGDGRVAISEHFVQKGQEIARIKVDAPSFVQPTGERTVSDSIAKLDETSERLAEMQPLFESLDCVEAKFPHPFFGDISAQEWLALKGGHEMRHIKQIERLASKLK